MITNICLVGMMGANKREIGKELALRLGMNYVDVDELLEYDHMPIVDLFLTYGENHFHYLERNELKRVCGFEYTLITTGCGVVFKNENIATMKKTCMIIFIDVTFSEIQNRIYNAEKTRDMARGMSIHRLRELYDDCYEKYTKYCDWRIDTSNMDTEQAVEAIYDYLVNV